MTRLSPQRRRTAFSVVVSVAAVVALVATPSRLLSQQQQKSQPPRAPVPQQKQNQPAKGDEGSGGGGGLDVSASDKKPWEDEATRAALEGRDPDPKKVESDKQAAAGRKANGAAPADTKPARPTAPGDEPKPWEDEATRAALEHREPDPKKVEAEKKAAAEKGAAASKPSTAPDGSSDAGASSEPADGLARKSKNPDLVNRALDQMTVTYEKRMDTPDWVSRALSTISLARIPRPAIVKRMLDICEQDKSAVVKLLAWQAVLSRAGTLTPEQHERWVKVSLTMAEKGTFNGPLRVDLLKLLATAPPSPAARRVFGLLFDTCNAWEPEDIPTLDALANTLKTWRSFSLATALVGKLTDPDSCVRAQYVLKKAGYDGKDAVALVGPTAMDSQAPKRVHPSSTDLWKSVQAEAGNWLGSIRGQWKGDAAASATKSAAAASEDSAGTQAWKDLAARFVPPPPTLDSVDINDPVWKTDLELGRVNLTEFEVCFVVDATGTMTEEIAWVRRDVGNILRALAMVSTKPRLGVTFYRDKGPYGFVTKNLPLTNNVQALMPDLNAMTADGGGDIPEAVIDGLRDALTKNKWTSKNAKAGSRVIILIGDAPPHPQDVQGCLKLAGDWARDGYRFNCGKCKSQDVNNDLSTFDEIAKAGRGVSVELEFPTLSPSRFLDKAGKPIPPQTIPRPETQLIVAPPPPKEEQPGALLMAKVLGNAMNPQYQNRMDPLTKTLLAYCEQREKEKRLAFPPNTPSMVAGTMKKQ